MRPRSIFVAWLALQAGATSQTVERVSIGSLGQEANGRSGSPAISADGRYVAFRSLADNLVPGDSNGVADVFVRDRVRGITERVSVDSRGGEAHGPSDRPVLSADGRFVAFESDAPNLVDGDRNRCTDVFIRDRWNGTTERVSVGSRDEEANGRSEGAAISRDGRFIAFASEASNLAAGDDNHRADVFLHDRSTRTTERISINSQGAGANHLSLGAALSDDGQIVAFSSYASNLDLNDRNRFWDAFVRDRRSGTTHRLSVGPDGREVCWESGNVDVSADGTLVVFEGSAELIGRRNRFGDQILVRDVALGSTSLVSRNSEGKEANWACYSPSLSADGRNVAFESYASNLSAGIVLYGIDIFVRDRIAGFTARVSQDALGRGANLPCEPPKISADGRFVAFASSATNLVAGDANGEFDVFVAKVPWSDASWETYGTGFPGTAGVPTLLPRAQPVLSTALDVDLSNSAGAVTPGLLFIGFRRASIHSSRGGDLLVDPVLSQPVTIPANGLALSLVIPHDESLFGLLVDLQALELDPGAAKGISFTAGLELVLGR
jgi:Tol biopolymer transport system component